jgi:subfamily B ATP-binding cassette protein MsbA
MGDLLTISVFVSVMLAVNWKLALLVFSTIPMLIFATNIFKRGVQSTFHDVRNAVAELNTFVQEHIQGIRIIQIFNRQQKEFDAFDNINKKHKAANVRSIWYYSVFFPIVEILSSISIGLLIFFAGVFPESLKSTPGEITFFIMLTNMMFRPIRMLADRLNTLQMGIVASERVFKVLDTKAEIENSGTLRDIEIKGKIEFDNVFFHYNPEHEILKGISFTLNAGKSLAVVGSTGAGKSTLINLLGRFYEYQSGEIKVDDRSIRDYELNFLRKSTGIVQQDTFLFDDTIINNITLFDENISLETVVNAAKEIDVHDFVMQLPGNYHFKVGERGSRLSAGQRQLIAFIRVCVFKPSILILDEATSSVDTQSEELIKKATAKITQNRTSIIIAHRLATVQNADEIIVMENGMIEEKGSFKSLLEQKGKFSKLHHIQFKSELLNA